jgi:hypothetical protein
MKYLAEVPRAKVGILSTKRSPARKEFHFLVPAEPRIWEKDDRNQSWQYVLGVLKNLKEKGSSVLATPDEPLRLPSGGCLDVITDTSGRTFIPIEQRDDKPGIRAPGFQNPWLGYPLSFGECLSGEYIAREANEEAVYTTIKSNSAYSYETILLPEDRFERDTVLSTVKKLGIRQASERAEMKYDDLASTDLYRLYVGGEKRFSTVCSLTFWPTPDIIKIRRIQLPTIMERSLIYHGANRTILVVEDKELKEKTFGSKIDVIKMSTNYGKRTSSLDKAVFRPTSALKGALNMLGIYPNSWVDETYCLLSNPDFQQLLEANPGVDPFTLENTLWEQGKHP